MGGFKSGVGGSFEIVVVVWVCGCSSGWTASAGPEVEAEDFEDTNSRGARGGGRGSGDFEDEAVATVV